MLAEGAGDLGEERMGRSIVPARASRMGDPCEDIRFITTGGMEYAVDRRAVGRSGQRRL